MGGKADRAGLRASGGVSDGAQAYRAGIGHREAGSTGTEMVQVGLGYPLADRHAVSALSHRDLLQFLFTRLLPWSATGGGAVKIPAVQHVGVVSGRESECTEPDPLGGQERRPQE
jgi:hypothetical protein